ncbi:MAG: GGDEF domain-containing protein [Ruminococcaceae bacterium]|nr:GGDEF domain-containing protein [Oscillospiraceae bacterium]
MQNAEQIIDALMEMILNTEFEETDVHSLYEKLQPYLAPFAEAYQVAKINLHIEYAPNVYDISGRGDTFESVYSEDASDEPMELTFADLYMTTGVVKIYPCRGVEWGDATRRAITAVTRLSAMQFSRANMVRRIERLSYIDLLTGLANAPGVAYYGTRIEQNGSTADYAGCFLNIKNFKYFNQSLSDSGGDAVIRQYALRLYGFMDHRSELVARLGGDDFFVLVKKERLDRFLRFASPLSLILNNEAKRTRVTIESWIGVYLACEGDSVTTIMHNAAFANTQAKQTLTSVAYLDPEAKAQMLRSREIVHILPDALREHELVAYYQPKVGAGDGELCGGEALVRWQRDGKLIPPNEFLSAAESGGLIPSIDLYMLETVCDDLRKWLDAGIEPVRISVNFSKSSFLRDSLVKDTLDLLRKYCIDGSYLEIEVTESAFYECRPALEAFIETMHKTGVTVSLDNFGTGYSSLNMLKSLDLDTVKLDKSFFSQLDSQSEQDRILLRSMASMIGDLNKTAVSEGVENVEQIDLARRIGCEVVQGFFFDKPLSCDEFTARLLDRHYKVSGAAAE